MAFRLPFGTIYSSNITADPDSGIGSWSEEDITTLLKTGQTPEFDFVGGAMGEVGRFQLEAAIQSAHVVRRVTGRADWAAIERLSRVNKRSPSFTRAPSLKWTPVISLSTRERTATLAMVVTLPSDSMPTGVGRRFAVTTSTGTSDWPIGA